MAKSGVKTGILIKKGDLIQVIAGADGGKIVTTKESVSERGKRGRVLSVNRKTGKVYIENINMIFKHVKPSQKNPAGGRVKREAAIDASNLMIVCAKCDQPVRVQKKLLADGRKVRVCKKCGEEIGTK